MDAEKGFFYGKLWSTNTGNLFAAMDELFKKLKRPFHGSWEAVESDKACFEHILIRLPVKSVLMAKCVSKLWHAVMSTWYFIIMHRLWSKKHPKYLTFYDSGEDGDNIVHEMHQMEPNGTFSETYVIPELADIRGLYIMASFNGLICLLNDVSPSMSSYEIDIRICNPATREVLLLPRGHPDADLPRFGLVYSKRCHFYKIFKFFFELSDLPDGYARCEVYSSKTRAWKYLGKVPSCPLINPYCPLVANYVCVNEKLYWFIPDEEEFCIPIGILTVDMDENFGEIEIPTKTTTSFLIEFSGRLCFVDWTGLSILIWLYDEKINQWKMVGMPKFPVHWRKVDHFDAVVAHGQEILFVYQDCVGLRYELMYDMHLKRWKDFRIAEDCKGKPLTVFRYRGFLKNRKVNTRYTMILQDGRLVWYASGIWLGLLQAFMVGE